jgi:hypothetical protein
VAGHAKFSAVRPRNCNRWKLTFIQFVHEWLLAMTRSHIDNYLLVRRFKRARSESTLTSMKGTHSKITDYTASTHLQNEIGRPWIELAVHLNEEITDAVSVHIALNEGVAGRAIVMQLTRNV